MHLWCSFQVPTMEFCIQLDVLAQFFVSYTRSREICDITQFIPFVHLMICLKISFYIYNHHNHKIWFHIKVWSVQIMQVKMHNNSTHFITCSSSWSLSS
jgi:hypothetical protein